MPTTDAPPIPEVTFNFNMDVAAAFPAGLAWFDGAWWSCMTRQLTRFDPVTQDVTVTPYTCWGLVMINGQLAVNTDLAGGEGIQYYTSGAQVLAGTPAAVVPETWEQLIHGASDGVTLWDGSGPSPVLACFDLASGALSWFGLPFEMLVNGVGTLNGNVWVVAGGQGSPDYRTRVYELDPGTGAIVSQVAVASWPGDEVYGLWCGTL